ncbi:Hypothetical predicted protein [Pelobates cultripes]|uniref:Uncharacterized protein n=1 Tax=Pelobates cultripes TaxID=61616 RepID=A0AAD1TGD3_PELCU|nr:Hypothetical predicted protein [Pelobates cultripes]
MRLRGVREFQGACVAFGKFLCACAAFGSLMGACSAFVGSRTHARRSAEPRGYTHLVPLLHFSSQDIPCLSDVPTFRLIHRSDRRLGPFSANRKSQLPSSGGRGRSASSWDTSI